MRSRWYHRPLLHSPALGVEKKATWLELFYDLIFVAAFIQLGNGLSAHVSVNGALAFVGIFVPLWVAWSGFTFFVNRFTVDDFLQRLVVFVQMFAVGAMAISAPLVLEGEPRAFSFSAAAAQLSVGLMHVRAYSQVPEARAYARYWGAVFLFSGGIWLLSAFVEAKLAYPIWALATLLVLVSPLHPRSLELSERFPLDFEHLGERYGLLTIIVLGESFVKVLSALAAEGAGLMLYMDAGVSLLLTCGIWWVYFDDVAGAHLRPGRMRWVIWLYAHLPLQLSITVSGVAIKKAVHFSWDAPAPEGYRWLLAGSLALVYFSVAIIDSVTLRRQVELSDRARINLRAASGLLLLVLAPAGKAMSGGFFLVVVTAVNVAQVLFDMMMAPLEESEHAELGKKTTAELHRERVAGEGSPRAGRPRVGDAIRKGIPRELRQDFYFYFIDGSWWRLLSVVAFLFLIVNVFFAALYVMEPGAVANASPRAFEDAFYFSVQTMSTIGYGTLRPATPYGNLIVTVEAAVSIIGVAVITGLVFAKLSRPTAGVLFSEPMVITRMHGKDVLMFRAGNTRGNEIIDASMDLTILMDEISPEGHHLRRLHELPLTRSRSPMFMLTWTCMHEIDDASPLHLVDWEDPSRQIVAIIATMTGHDGTYGQTVYARHMYDCDDLRRGERFVDIISELEDGRMMVDYDRFHDTESEDPGGEAS